MGNSQGKQGRGGTMGHQQMHHMGGNSHGGPNNNMGGKKGGQYNRFNTDLDGFHGDQKKLSHPYGGSQIQQYQPQQQ